MASTHQAQSTNFLKPSYGEMHESPCPSYRRPAMLQQTYDGSTSEMDCVRNPSPMLGVDYTQWNLGRRQGSFAEFSNAQNGLKNSYQSSNEADITLFASANSLAQPQSPYQSLSGGSSDDILKSDKTSPSTVYSSYSSPSASIDPQSLAYLLPNAHEALTKSTWWPEHSQPSKNQSREIYGMLPPHDGLSQGYGPQHEWNNVWNFSGGSATSWVLAQATPATVSPKALTLNVPPAPLSSSGSSQGRALSHSDSNTGSSSGDDNSDFSGPETLSVVEPPRAVRRPRQILPDSVPGSQRIYQAVASDVPAKSSRKRLFKSRSGSDEEEESNQPYRSPTSKAKASSPKRVSLAPLKLFVPKRIEPKPAELSAASQGTQDRDVKDDFLVKSKLSGMSYKEIRRQGNFTEAESTLRGRFRTLTKHKAARVRKPEWCENDVRMSILRWFVWLPDICIDPASEEGSSKARQGSGPGKV